MNLDLARWQFAIVTVYHFLFVPLTIGLSFLVAGMQTAWVRTGAPTDLVRSLVPGSSARSPVPGPAAEGTSGPAGITVTRGIVVG